MTVTPTSAVPYTWNNYDRLMACLHGSVTPYDIPGEKLNEAWSYPTNVAVQIPLGLTLSRGTVQRFFREGYEWVKVPEGVEAPTILALLPKLHAHDPVRFAHLDPLLVTATAAHRNVERVKRMTHSTLDVTANNALQADPTIAVVNQIATVLKEVGEVAELMPYEDLVRLHFEYWGNSKLRGAFVNQRLPPIFAEKWDIFQMFPFVQMPGQLIAKLMFGVTGELIPQALTAPTSVGDAKLEYVLARKAIAGVPIRSPGAKADRTSTGATLRVFSIKPPRIELDGFAVQEIRPIHLKEWKTGSSAIAFRITLPAPAKKTLVEIVHQRSVIYTRQWDGGEFLLPGVHLFAWDGYDDQGVFDTIRMKDGLLEARVTTVDMLGRTAVGRTQFRGGPGTMRWLDARLDRQKKTAEVTVYAHFRKPSEVEVSGFKLPVSKGLADVMSGAISAVSGMESSILPLVPGVDKIPETTSLDDVLDGTPLLDLVKPPSVSEMLNNHTATISIRLPGVFDLNDDEFETFKNDIVFGIGKHWSRMVTLDSEPWALAVSCRERPVDNIPIFLMKGITDMARDSFGRTDTSPVLGSGRGLDRSFNMACFAEGLPIVDIWDDGDASDRRRVVGAHELGHSVLREAYDPFTSATHKGTTTIFGAAVAKEAALVTSGVSDVVVSGITRSDPLGDEIDLMYYQADSGKHNESKHHIAIEDDARALLWLSRVVLG
ncbi:MAG: hypothetical protein U0414_36305 [Polyangiaceae bacterium]